MNRPTDEIDSRIDMERVLSALTPTQARAVTLIRLGYRKSDIARKEGKSRSTITRIFNELRNKRLFS